MALVTAWSAEFAGLIIGKGTSYSIATIDGLGSPEVRTSDMERLSEHGEFVGLDLYRGRTLTLDVQISGLTEALVATRLDTFKNAFQVSDTLGNFDLLLHGWTATRRLYARARRMAARVPFNSFIGGRQDITVEMFAADPRFYTIVESSLAGAGTAVVGGNFPQYGRFELAGASTNPTVTVGSRTFKIDVTVPGGQTLLVDFRLRTVTLNSVDKLGDVRTDSQWPIFAPGNNSVSFTGGGTLNTFWTNAYL